jgi:tRNA A37 threonylcarbamoyladenosine biosynthesis protein TsaE
MRDIVTCKSDHRDLRIYINGVLHVHLLKSSYVTLQSYLVGSENQIYHIDIYTTSTLLDLEYDDRELWITILNLLDKNI